MSHYSAVARLISAEIARHNTVMTDLVHQLTGESSIIAPVVPVISNSKYIPGEIDDKGVIVLDGYEPLPRSISLAKHLLHNDGNVRDKKSADEFWDQLLTWEFEDGLAPSNFPDYILIILHNADGNQVHLKLLDECARVLGYSSKAANRSAIMGTALNVLTTKKLAKRATRGYYIATAKGNKAALSLIKSINSTAVPSPVIERTATVEDSDVDAGSLEKIIRSALKRNNNEITFIRFGIELIKSGLSPQTIKLHSFKPLLNKVIQSLLQRGIIIVRDASYCLINYNGL